MCSPPTLDFGLVVPIPSWGDPRIYDGLKLLRLSEMCAVLGSCSICLLQLGPIKTHNSERSERVSTGLWCVPRLGAGFVFALEPSELQKLAENPGKGTFIFCAKRWCAPNPG